MDDDRLLTRLRAAQELEVLGRPVTVTTLETLATRGGGPLFHKNGRRVVYRYGDLEIWARAKLRGPFTSTSQDVEE